MARTADAVFPLTRAVRAGGSAGTTIDRLLPTSPLGELGGRYRSLGPLGSGGMGEVFLAHDRVLERPVAIKRLRPEYGSGDDARERVRNEARLNAKLSHPNIVRVYDVLRDSGVDHIVSEYVEGHSLRELVSGTALELSDALEILVAIARGLEFAHAGHVIHRDLKTENVLVGRDQSVKIADFGLAFSLIDSSTSENSTPRMGTTRTMSPEQSVGAPNDARSDLFSFGVLAYEVVSGVSPFLCAGAKETLQAIRGVRQRPLAEWGSEIPLALSRLVDQLLEKDPAMRPESATEVLRELETISSRTRRATGAGIARPREPFRSVAVVSIVVEDEVAAGVESRARRVLDFQAEVGRKAASSGGEVVAASGCESVLCFGVRQAHLHDCRNAAALALALLDHASEMGLVAHAGLDNGDALAMTDARPTLLVGTPVDDARWLAHAAGTDELLVSARAQARLREVYHLIPRGGPRSLERASLARELGPSYEVVGRTNRVHRERERPSPMFGRDELLTRLRHALQPASSDVVRVVGVSGEAGVGKSRLVEEFLRTRDTSSTTLLRMTGSQERRYSPFGALQTMLRKWLGLDGLPEKACRARLADLAVELPHPQEMEAPLALMCGVAGDDDRTLVRLRLRREAEDSFAITVRELLQAEARKGPILLVVEDAHWLDQSSWEVVRAIAESRDATRLSVLATYRPESVHAWGEHEITVVEVPRLEAFHARRLIGAIAGSALKEGVVEQVLEVGDGLPLVLEELSRAAVEAAGSGQISAPAVSTLGQRVSDSLEALAGPLRAALEIGALLGSRFDSGVFLQALGGSAIAKPYVDALLERTLLRESEDGSNRLAFSHPLVRDAVKECIDPARRKDLHGRIVAGLDRAKSTNVALELIAHHCEHAGLVERATVTWILAGEEAANDHAHATALAHFDHALSLLPSIGAPPRAVELELEIRQARGASLAQMLGWGAEPVEANSRRIAEIERHAGAEAPPPALWQAWAYGYAVGDMALMTRSLGAIEDRVAAAPRTEAPLLRYLLAAARGITYVHLGRLPQARTALRESLRLRPQVLAELRNFDQPEPIVAPSSYLAWVEMLVGDRTRAWEQQSTDEDDESLTANERRCSLSFGAQLGLASREHDAAIARARQVADAPDQGLAPQHRESAAMILATADLERGVETGELRVGETIEKMTSAFERWRSGFMRPSAVVSFVSMADACLAVVRSTHAHASDQTLADAKAHALIERGLHEIEVLDPAIHRYYMAEVYRVQAAHLRVRGDEARAQATLRIARQRAQALDAGEHGAAWMLLDRIAAAMADRSTGDP